MRKLLMVAAAIAVGALSLGSAKADPGYYPGGEMQRAGMCQVSTDGGEGFYGYMAPCPTAPKVMRRHKKRASH
jgi:hypothetical protein